MAVLEFLLSLGENLWRYSGHLLLSNVKTPVGPAVLLPAGEESSEDGTDLFSSQLTVRQSQLSQPQTGHGEELGWDCGELVASHVDVCEGEAGGLSEDRLQHGLHLLPGQTGVVEVESLQPHGSPGQ